MPSRVHVLFVVGSHGRPCHAGAMDDCVFCSIIAGAQAAEIVLDDHVALGFFDRSPLFHGHTLVVPKQHVVTLTDLDPAMVGPLYQRVQRVAAAMPIATGKPGTFIANNNIVSQSVAHLHIHVVPRERGDGLRGFFWPRTKYDEAIAAEIADAMRLEIGT